MNHENIYLKVIKSIGLALTFGVSMSACATGGTTTWKEEVLLHDGSKIIVERTHTYGGFGEIAQGRLIVERTTTFIIPGSSEIVTWKSEYGRENQDNLDLMVLDFMGSTPYIATSLAGVIAYQKWGKPNPPYVFFKYVGKTWRRISPEEFPAEFRDANVIINTKAHEKKLTNIPVLSEQIKELNSSLIKEYRTVLRTPIDYGPPRPEYKGPKAPHPITPPTTTDEN